MLDRFIGEANITFRDNSKEFRRVIVLSPYIKSSDSLRDIDYENALVVDLQTMEFDFKVQLEDMLQNQELHQFHTFIEYAHRTVFRNGENVLAWLHRMGQITKIPCSEVYMVFGQGGNVQKMSLVDLNREIKLVNERTIAEQDGISSSYTDPSMSANTVQPATIEKSGNAHKEQINESVSAQAYPEQTPEVSDTQPGVDLSQVPGVTIFEGDSGQAPVDSTPEPDSTNSTTRESTQQTASDVDIENIKENLASIETLVRKRTKDTFITRLMDKYELSDSEVTKAIESAGLRKIRKAEKDKAKSQQSES